jgi:hypothetical protein
MRHLVEMASGGMVYILSRVKLRVTKITGSSSDDWIY